MEKGCLNMYANVNAPPTLGANVPPQPNMAPAFVPSVPSYTAPAYSYGCPTYQNNNFVLIVVLFILLIIVGACICK